MSSAAFDNLAANGIINFDADAYIKGTTPRYVGNPGNANAMPFQQPLMPGPYYPQLGAQLPQQPVHDEFKQHETHKKAGLKELFTFGVVGGFAVYIGVRFKNAIKSLFAKKPPKTTTPPPAITAATTKKTGLFTKFKNSKPAKIFAAVGVGLLGLYGLYDFIMKRKASAQFAGETPNPTQHAAPAKH